MITNVNHILKALYEWAPPHLKEDYDNIGLLIGRSDQVVNRVLVCLDITPQVVDEAIAKGCELLVAHHPIIFKKLSHVRQEDATGRLIYQLIKHDISVICMHTNLDAASKGVSFALADRLGLLEPTFLLPNQENAGFGVVGSLPEPLKKDDFLQYVAKRLQLPVIRYQGNASAVRRIAVCGGAGSFLIQEVTALSIDAFLTADLKYHDFFEGTETFLLCDIGHYESEIPIVAKIQEYLDIRFSSLTSCVTSVVTNSVNYYLSNIEITKST